MNVAGGTLQTGPGWEREGDTSLVRRGLRLEAGLAQRTILPPPFKHLAITAMEECPEVLITRVKAKLEERVPNLSVLREGAFSFQDGATGRCLCVELELIAGMPSRQLHVVRKDQGVTRHFVATVAGLDARSLESELAPMIESFRPRAAVERAAV